MNRKISVVIPTARRGDLLRNCLESLRRQTFPDFEVVVVSDGAGDWVAELAKEYGCNLVSLPQARGFAAAVNAGIEAGIAGSRSQYVALVNDDVQLDRDWLRLTFSLLDERPEFAFCCGKIYTQDGVVLDNAGDAVSLGGSAWRLGHGRRDSEAFDSPHPVLAFSGTAALLRRNVWEQLGGFDEDFVSYLEDIDFSLRAARHGQRVFYLPQAKSFHRGGATSGGPESPAVFRLLTQNQLLILAKHYPWQLCPRILWAQLLWAAMAVRKNRLRAYCSGVAGFLRLLPKALKKRRPWRREELREFIARLRESEREIYADTRATDRIGRDSFWRMYFFLSSTGSEDTRKREEPTTCDVSPGVRRR